MTIGRGRRAAATPFVGRVLAVVRSIPPGHVSTYGDVARLAGRPGAARAVGNIMRGCPDPSVPCHRVVAAGGALGGYGGRESVKRQLLMLEGVTLRKNRIEKFADRRWSGWSPRRHPGPGSAGGRYNQGRINTRRQ